MAEDIIQTLFDLRTAEAEAGLRRMELSMSKMDAKIKMVDRSARAGLRFDVSALKSEEAMEKFNKQLVRAEQNVKRTTGAFNRFDMRMLSILFLGMQMQRTFGGMMQGMVKTFMDAEQNTSGLNQAFTRLWASVEFLKFSLIDALDQDWFIGIINGIIGVIDWFSSLPEGVRAMIDLVIAAFAILGTGATVWVLVKGGFNSVFGEGGYLYDELQVAKKLIKKFSDAIPDDIKSKIKTGLDIAAGVTFTLTTIDLFTSDKVSLGSAAFNIASAAWLGARIGGFWGGVIATTISVGLIISAVMLKEDQKQRFVEARREMQNLINQAFSREETIPMDWFEKSITKSLGKIGNKDLINNMWEYREQFDLGIITAEEYRNKLSSLVGVVDKTLAFEEGFLKPVKQLDKSIFNKFLYGSQQFDTLNTSISDVTTNFTLQKDEIIPQFITSQETLIVPLDNTTKAILRQVDALEKLNNKKKEKIQVPTSEEIFNSDRGYSSVFG